jgi:hypothetical protein
MAPKLAQGFPEQRTRRELSHLEQVAHAGQRSHALRFSKSTLPAAIGPVFPESRLCAIFGDGHGFPSKLKW